jgi:hypothetical protein
VSPFKIVDEMSGTSKCTRIPPRREIGREHELSKCCSDELLSQHNQLIGDEINKLRFFCITEDAMTFFVNPVIPRSSRGILWPMRLQLVEHYRMDVDSGIDLGLSNTASPSGEDNRENDFESDVMSSIISVWRFFA